ncbi:hypothetical protein [Paraburkholderia sp.]|uniref:hypothetical protein n=1 Tax=Paraburkholderia sp. TaxID=1926495 RepID=UPI0025F330B6|nr:hypothetical protein [Paraburkholderia sp.]
MSTSRHHFQRGSRLISAPALTTTLHALSHAKAESSLLGATCNRRIFLHAVRYALVLRGVAMLVWAALLVASHT